MSTEVFPRPVFCVLRDKDGKLFVATRTLLGRSGSWYRFRTESGDEVKENGNRWSDTAMEAIHTQATYIMHRFRMPDLWSDQRCLDDMESLLKECFEWGKLVGAVEGMKGK